VQIEYNRISTIKHAIILNLHYDKNNCEQLCLQFYKRLTINLRIDIALFQLSIHSNMSLTFTLTDKCSVLAAYFPAVDLSDSELRARSDGL